MHTRPGSALALAFAVAACSAGDGADSPDRGPLVPAERVRFAGELVLRGDLPFVAGASVTLAVEDAGGGPAALARTWDLGDPVWRHDRDGARLYFALDARDAWPGAPPAVRETMEIAARFDPVGNPATEELGVVRTRLPVRAGDEGLVVELDLGRVLAVHETRGGG